MQELRAGGLQVAPPLAEPHQDQEPLGLLREEEPQALQFPARERKAKPPAMEQRAKESPSRHRGHLKASTQREQSRELLQHREEARERKVQVQAFPEGPLS